MTEAREAIKTPIKAKYFPHGVHCFVDANGEMVTDEQICNAINAYAAGTADGARLCIHQSVPSICTLCATGQLAPQHAEPKDRGALIEAAKAFLISKLPYSIQRDTLYHEYWEWMADFAIAQTQKAAQPAESEFCECGHSQVSHWLPKSACEGFGQCDCPQYRPAARRCIQ